MSELYEKQEDGSLKQVEIPKEWAGRVAVKTLNPTPKISKL